MNNFHKKTNELWQRRIRMKQSPYSRDVNKQLLYFSIRWLCAVRMKCRRQKTYSSSRKSEARKKKKTEEKWEDSDRKYNSSNIHQFSEIHYLIATESFDILLPQSHQPSLWFFTALLRLMLSTFWIRGIHKIG